MFQNDVTKTYGFQDATLEIIIMLAGAFLLGAFFCWLLHRLRRNSTLPEPISRKKAIQHQGSFIKPEKSSNIKAAAQGIAVDTLKDEPKEVTEVDDPIQPQVVTSNDEKTTVPQPQKTEHSKAQAPSSAITEKKEAVSEETTDNFKKIDGIGPKIETILHQAGIKTYADLRASDSDTLKNILKTKDPILEKNDPETWPYQAELAYKGKWDKLKEYQNFLMGSTQ